MKITKPKFRKTTRKIRALALVFVLVLAISGTVTTFCGSEKKAEAAFCSPCVLCFPFDGPAAALIAMVFEGSFWSPVVRDAIEDHMNSERNYIVKEFFRRFWVQGLGEMSEFLAAFGVYQVEIVGTFFDAKAQLETQRLLFKLQAEAHKDYQPSDDFCWFGTNTRSLASSEHQAQANFLALSRNDLARQLGIEGGASAKSHAADLKARWDQFTTTYCDQFDNNWFEIGSGLDHACDNDGLGSGTATGATDRQRINRDIDYTALIDEPRTLDVDFLNRSYSDLDEDGTNDDVNDLSDNEADVLAMSRNLYGYKLPSRSIGDAFKDDATRESALKLYMQQRGVMARRNVAQSSFNSIVAMKSEGSNGDKLASEKPQVGATMAALIRDIMPAGSSNEEIVAIMGQNPSYYAQLEFLAKKLYQDPKFFANLYDTPANVERKSVAMKAVGLMLDRALFESELRQEMLLSVMLSNELYQRQGEINVGIDEAESN